MQLLHGLAAAWRLLLAIGSHTRNRAAKWIGAAPGKWLVLAPVAVTALRRSLQGNTGPEVPWLSVCRGTWPPGVCGALAPNLVPDVEASCLIALSSAVDPHFPMLA